MIAAGNNSLWKKLCAVLDMPELGEDVRFAENPDRDRNHDEMFELLSERLRLRDGEEWVKLLDEAGVPCSLINTMDRVLENEQLKARSMFIDIEHPGVGTEKLIGIPIKMGDTPGSIRKAAPDLGEDTRKVLREYAGLTDSEMDALESEGVI